MAEAEKQERKRHAHGAADAVIDRFASADIPTVLVCPLLYKQLIDLRRNVGMEEQGDPQRAQQHTEDEIEAAQGQKPGQKSRREHDQIQQHTI